MLQGCFGGDAGFGVVDEDLTEEVEKLLVEFGVGRDYVLLKRQVSAVLGFERCLEKEDERARVREARVEMGKGKGRARVRETREKVIGI